MGRACCYIIYGKQKEEIFLLMFPFRYVIIIATKLKQNNNNRKGNIIKMLPQTLLFLRYENMITQDNEKIKSTFKKNFLLMYYYCLCQIYPCYGHFLTLGIIRKTATTIERSVI